MPPQLRLHSGQLADLAEIRDTSPDLLITIAERFTNIHPHPMRAGELHHEISQVLGDRPNAANRILRTLLALQPILRHRRLTADELITVIRQCLEVSEPRWEAAELERWRAVERSFKLLLLAPMVRLVSATLDLMCEYQNLLQSTRIITDIRPVFSEEANPLEGLGALGGFEGDRLPLSWCRIQQIGVEDYRPLADLASAINRTPTQFVVTEKRTILEEFVGVVDQIDGTVAYVTLTANTGEKLSGEYPSEELESRGIREHRRFRCRTLEIGTRVEFELEPIPDCEVSEQRERAIDERLRDALGRDDGPQDDY